MDISPYATEIAANLKLLQDRVQTETPQGQHHTVIRWIHRSSFQLQGDTPLLPIQPRRSGPTPLIDSSWEGTVYVEAEGTNEGLEELQDRVGGSVTLFPVRSAANASSAQFPSVNTKKNVGGGKREYRMMRGNSRPGELWLRCVREKEKIA